MTINTQAYLHGYLSKEATEDPMGLLDLQGLSSVYEMPSELSTTLPFSEWMRDALSYKNEEEAQKDRLGLKNYRALQRAAKADPQSPIVETWPQWKLKNTPPYKLKHLLSREQAEAMGLQPRLLAGVAGFHHSQYPYQLWLDANPASHSEGPAIAGHEAVHARQDIDRGRKHLEDTVQSWNTPWYGRLAARVGEWKERRRYQKEYDDSLERFRKEEDSREYGLRDLRRAGIPPSRYAGDFSPEYRAYRSQPHEEEAYSEGESWAMGQNLPHGMSKKGVPEWYRDILNTRGEEAATLEYRRRRALMSRKILKARGLPAHTSIPIPAQQKTHSKFTQPYFDLWNILSPPQEKEIQYNYAPHPWDVRHRRAERQGILKLLEDPNSPFREKLLQAGWGNVTHGRPTADEGKQ